MRQAYIILILFLIPSIVIAEPLEIKITPLNQTTNYRVEANFTIEVKNNQDKTDTFSFSADGFYSSWFSTYNWTLVVKNNSVERARFVLFPSSDIGKFSYKITAFSTTNSSVNATQEVNLSVLHPEGLMLREYYPKWRGKFYPNFFVKTDSKRTVTILLEILDSKGIVVEKTTASKEIEGVGNIYEFVGVGSLEAGKYKLRASIQGTSIVKEEDIEVAANESVKVNRKTDSNALFQEVKIFVTNIGNTREINYSVFETLPVGTPVNFITPISYFEKRDRTVKYAFNIGELKPGDTAEIIYRIEYWQSILITSAIIIIAVGIMVWYLNRLRNPRIRKKYLKKKAGFTVVLEVRGSMFNELKNVTVRDWISSLATVKQNFETLKPVVRSSAVGTELIWKLGDLRKGEDRIIHYDISPNQLGTIKLDKAWMRYSKTEDKQYKKFSNVIVVEAAKGA